MNKIVAIHQPNFFPWLGYFEKIARSDIFVVLDHVQYQKTGGAWSNRVKLRLGGEARWATAPINRNFRGVARIDQIEWATGDPWRNKLVKSLESNYGQAPFFTETINALGPLIFNTEPNLSKYNLKAIEALAGHVGISNSHCILSSTLDVGGQANEMLVAVTRAVGGTTYMCGGGADGYQDEVIFEAAGIRLVHQGFQHPVYPQSGGGAFIPGLSIVDALMNVGVDGVRALLNLR